MKKALFLLAFLLVWVPVYSQTTTTNLGIAKPQPGQSQPSTTIATGFDSFDSAVAGRLSKSVAGSSNVTLTASESRNAIIETTGLLTGSINVIVPTSNKLFLWYNGTTGAFTLTVKTSGGTGIAVTQGNRVWLYCDGTNVVESSVSSGGASTALSNLTTTNINTALLFQTGIDVGSALKPAHEIWFYGSGTFGSHSIKITGTPTGNRVITAPDRTATMATTTGTLTNGRCVEFDASGNLVDAASGAPCGAGGGGAATTLNNLGSVSINAALGFQTTLSVGSTTTPPQYLFLYGAGTYGSHSIRLGGTPTGHRQIVFPDASTNLLGDTTSQTVGSKVIDNSNTFSGYNDRTRISAPSNPSAGSLRVYANNATGKLACLDSSGADCMPTAGSAAWSSLTDPSGNLALAMATNLTAFTWGSNYGSTTAAIRFVGANTSATAPLVEMVSGGSNNMSVLILKPRGGRSFEALPTGSLTLGKDSPGNTDTDGYMYLGVIGSNLFPSGTPTSNTGFAPITLQSNGTAGDYSIWGYMGSAWRDLGGNHKRYDTGSGNGAQTIDFNSSTSANVTRIFTLSGGNATFTFSNAPKIGSLVTITLVQDGTGSRTVTWPASVKWSAATAPTLTLTANKRDVFLFFWDGTNYWNIAQTLNL